MRIDLQIGGYRIRLDEREDHTCLAWPLSPFDFFLAPSAAPPDIDFQIRVVKQLPAFPEGRLVFDACHGLWKLYESTTGYLLETADTQSLEPRSRAVISPDFSHVEVWLCSRPTPRGAHTGWMPMHVFNPIVEACFLTKLAREGGLLLHSAGILTEHGGWVFTGASGAGKSTLSDLFAARGRRILSDERVIIRKVADEWVAYGTPWVGSGRHANNHQGPLTGIYCISHGERAHALRPISPRDFTLFVLRQCFLPHWDREAMDRTLASLGELVERIGYFDLAFVKSPDIVDYLDAHALERASVAP